jgi:hypothetical protein
MNFKFSKFFILVPIFLCISVFVYFFLISIKNRLIINKIDFESNKDQKLQLPLLKNEKTEKIQYKNRFEEKSGNNIRIFCMIFIRPNIFSTDQVIIFSLKFFLINHC